MKFSNTRSVRASHVHLGDVVKGRGKVVGSWVNPVSGAVHLRFADGGRSDFFNERYLDVVVSA